MGAMKALTATRSKKRIGRWASGRRAQFRKLKSAIHIEVDLELVKTQRSRDGSMRFHFKRRDFKLFSTTHKWRDFEVVGVNRG